MTKTKVDDWSTTAASNADINSISILGTAPVSNFDNAFREAMAQIAATPLAESADDMRDNLSVWGRAESSRVFATVADMVAATDLAVGQRATTLGYRAAGDGGGNDYAIVAAATGTADGGLYIDLTGSSLQAKGMFISGIACARQFGAYMNRGAGNTDDTAFVTAFESATLTGIEKQHDYALSYFAANFFNNANVIVPQGTKLRLPSTSVTLDVDDDLASLLPRMPRDQRVYLPNRTIVDPYTSTGTVTIKDPIRITAVSTGNCGFAVPLSFEQSGGKSWIEGLDFVPRADYTAIVVDGAGTLYIDDPKATATAIAAKQFLQSYSGNIYMRALTRNCIMDYTLSTNAVPLVELNYLSMMWMSTSGVGTQYGWWKAPNLSTWTITATMAGLYQHNWRVDGGGKTGLSSGVLLQRFSRSRFSQDALPGTGLGLQNLLKGLQAVTGAYAYISGSATTGTGRFYVASCGTGLDTTSGGTVEYETASTLFSGNTTNTTSGAAAMARI